MKDECTLFENNKSRTRINKNYFDFLHFRVSNVGSSKASLFHVGIKCGKWLVTRDSYIHDPFCAISQ